MPPPFRAQAFGAIGAGNDALQLAPNKNLRRAIWYFGEDLHTFWRVEQADRARACFWG